MYHILSPIADADLAKCTPAAGRYASVAGTTVRPWEECVVAEGRLYSRVTWFNRSLRWPQRMEPSVTAVNGSTWPNQ
jgi:hypothetical protein